MSDKATQDEAKPAEASQPDPIQQMRERGKSPELAAVLAWLIPGSGHLYAGFRVKGIGALVFVLGLFTWGLLLSRGDAVSLRKDNGHEYAFLAQIGAGLPTLVGLAYNHEKIPGFKPEWPDINDPADSDRYAARLPDNDTGLLFTMIAGLLNLLLIHDALNGVPGGIARREEEERRKRRIAALRKELEEERSKQAAEAAETVSDEAKAATEETQQL